MDINLQFPQDKKQFSFSSKCVWIIYKTVEFLESIRYSRLPNVTTKWKEPHACTIGWNIDSNKPHASPGLYSSNAFVVIKAVPIYSSKSHIVLNKPHGSLFGPCIEMNKPSVRNKAIGCYIPQSRVIHYKTSHPLVKFAQSITVVLWHYFTYSALGFATQRV